MPEPVSPQIEDPSNKVTDPAPTPDPIPDPAPTPDPIADPAPVTDPVDPPPWEPNYKYSVLDKEHEVPEFLREAIKDEGTQKQLIELLEKSGGLEHVKEKFGTTKEKLQTVEGQYNEVKGGLAELKQHLKHGDFDSFFKKLAISEDSVLQWVVDKVQYREMDPAQKAQADQNRFAQQQAWDAERNQQSHQQQVEDQLVQAKAAELKYVLLRPDVTEFSRQFDERMGAPNSFRNAVLQQGEMAWQLEKKDISIEEAARRVMGFSGVQLGQNPFQVGQLPPGTLQNPIPGQPPVAPKIPPKVIPNIAGKAGTSAGQGAVKTIEELKTRYQNFK